MGRGHADDRAAASIRPGEALGRRHRGAQARDGASVRVARSSASGARPRTGLAFAPSASVSASTAPPPAFPPRAAPEEQRQGRRAHRAAPRASPRARTCTRPRPPWPPRRSCSSSTTSSSATRAGARLRLAAPRKADRANNRSRARLSLILSRHFFVEAIWIPVYRPREGKRGSVLEICGSPDNVEIAEYVHGYLVDDLRDDSGASTKADRHPIEPRPPDLPRRRHDRHEREAHARTGRRARPRAWSGWPTTICRTTSAGGIRTCGTCATRGSSGASATRTGARPGKKIVIHKGVRENARERGLLLGPGRADPCLSVLPLRRPRSDRRHLSARRREARQAHRADRSVCDAAGGRSKDVFGGARRGDCLSAAAR